MMKTVKEHNIKADDVAEIKVEVIARAADILGDPHKYRPDSKETADHSLPFCMAAGLVDGMVTPLQHAAGITDSGYNRFWREAVPLLG
jgi:2-methylcitrate dehydratase